MHTSTIPQPATPGSPQPAHPTTTSGPRLTWNLTLQPPSLQHAFQQSQVYQQHIKFADWWHLYYTLGTNLLLLRWLHHGEKLLHFRLYRVICVCLVVAALWQSCFCWARRRTYQHWRPTIVLANRLARFVLWTIPVTLTAQAANSPALLPHLQRFYTTALFLPSTYGTLRACFMVSHANLALSHTLALPLPFALELRFSAAYLALMLTTSLPTAQIILDLPDLHPQIHQILVQIDYWMQLLDSGLSLAPPVANRLAHPCYRPLGLPFLTTFMALYCGVLLPLYGAYRFDLTVKARFLHRWLHRQHQRRGPGGSSGTTAPSHHEWWVGCPLWRTNFSVWDVVVMLALCSVACGMTAAYATATGAGGWDPRKCQ